MALRALIVSPLAERLGGSEEMLWLWLAHREAGALEPSVVFLEDGSFVREVAELGVATRVLSAGRLREPGPALRTVWALAGQLRRLRPDVVVNWSAKAQLYGAPAAAVAGCGDRVVWWQHQIPARHWLDRAATRLATAAVGCSSAATQRAQAELRPRRRSFVVNPGIEIGPPPGGAAGLRAELGIPPERTVVGIVGRLQPWKGQDRFLRALAELRRRGRDVHGLLVGGDAHGLSPEYAASLERLVGELGLGERVTMTGQVDNPRPYLGLMDVAVNASEGEPFGIVLIEAMAAGVPVVAVASGGPLEIVEPGVTGLLAPSGEPGDLAAAIEELLADPARRATLAAAAAERCRERFTAARMSADLTAELGRVAGA
jgi:glycosyltransferase involved in cell wall biosynthesis